MQGAPQTFQYSANCQQSALSKNCHEDEPHQEISIEYIVEILKANIECFACQPFLEAQKKIIKGLQNLKNKVNEVIKSVEKDFMKLKLSSVMHLEDEQLLSSLVTIAKQDYIQMKEISCGDMSLIVSLLENSFPIDKKSEKKLMTEIQSMNARIKNDVMKLTSFLSNEGEAEAEEPKESSDDADRWRVVQCKGRRGRGFIIDKSDDEQEEKDQCDIQIQKRRRGGKNKTESNRMPIKEQEEVENSIKIKKLQDYPIEQLFNIRVKVLKIIKQFTVNGAINVEFNGGDDSGIAVCVMKKHPEIKKNSTIYVTNCRIYIFKNKIKQIQTSSSSRFTQSKFEMKYVDFQYNFTQESEFWLRKNRVKDASKNAGGIGAKKALQQPEGAANVAKAAKELVVAEGANLKINQIEPEVQSLNFFAHIVELKEMFDYYHCVLGDSTGIVDAQLPLSILFLKEGIVIRLENVKSEVINEHIVIMFHESSMATRIDSVRLKVNLLFNVSEAKWVQDGSQQSEEIQQYDHL